MITYKALIKNSIAVYINKKRVGTIKPTDEGYAYYPIGGNFTHGDVLPTIEQVKQTLNQE